MKSYFNVNTSQYNELLDKYVKSSERWKRKVCVPNHLAVCSVVPGLIVMILAHIDYLSTSRAQTYLAAALSGLIVGLVPFRISQHVRKKLYKECMRPFPCIKEGSMKLGAEQLEFTYNLPTDKQVEYKVPYSDITRLQYDKDLNHLSVRTRSDLTKYGEGSNTSEQYCGHSLDVLLALDGYEEQFLTTLNNHVKCCVEYT